jgi:phenylacetate-CoA ligase
MIILRGVNLFPTQIEELVMGMETLTPHFILELEKRGRMDTMTVRIERHPALDRATCEAAAEVLKQRIKVHVGSTVDVLVEEPGALPRSEGKYKRVYDNR